MTYSIVAHDPDTGVVGAAVQSHFFNAGVHVLHAEAAAGIVATQMLPDPAHGPRALAQLRAGASAAETLERIRSADPGAAVRQLAIVSVRGDAAAFTGDHCVEWSAHCVEAGVTAQAAMCRSPDTPGAMMTAFRAARGALADRLVAALDAGEACGGDWRGQKAAALVVVPTSATETTPGGRLIDLRVEDSARPLAELRRLVAAHRFHSRANDAFAKAVGGRVDDALADLDALEREDADDPDVAFRHALALTMAGDARRARARLEACYRRDEGWRSMVERLPAAGLLPNDAALLEVLTAPSTHSAH